MVAADELDILVEVHAAKVGVGLELKAGEGRMDRLHDAAAAAFGVEPPQHGPRCDPQGVLGVGAQALDGALEDVDVRRVVLTRSEHINGLIGAGVGEIGLSGQKVASEPRANFTDDVDAAALSADHSQQVARSQLDDAAVADGVR